VLEYRGDMRNSTEFVVQRVAEVT